MLCSWGILQELGTRGLPFEGEAAASGGEGLGEDPELVLEQALGEDRQVQAS